MSNSKKEITNVLEAVLSTPLNMRNSRKVLVPIPSFLLLNGLNKKGETMEKNLNQLDENLALFSILVEYSYMRQSISDGIVCVPSWHNLREWHGILNIRGGLYKNAIFRFKVVMDDSYPNTRPEIYILEKVFHSHVDYKTGKVDVKTLCPRWKHGEDFIVSLLMYLKEMFFHTKFMCGHINCYNPEASKCYNEDKPSYLMNARKCSEEMQKIDSENKTDDFIFESVPEKMHARLLAAILSFDEIDIISDSEEFTNWFCDKWIPEEYEMLDEETLLRYIPPIHTLICMDAFSENLEVFKK